MKKSKTIKLVLVTGLLAPAAGVFGHPLPAKHDASRFIIKSKSEKPRAGTTNLMTGYYYRQDTVEHHAALGSSSAHIVVRGGWGFFGHHSSVC